MINAIEANKLSKAYRDIELKNHLINIEKNIKFEASYGQYEIFYICPKELVESIVVFLRKKKYNVITEDFGDENRFELNIKWDK